jgi:putative serine protease PepD
VTDDPRPWEPSPGARRRRWERSSGSSGTGDRRPWEMPAAASERLHLPTPPAATTAYPRIPAGPRPPRPRRGRGAALALLAALLGGVLGTAGALAFYESRAVEEEPVATPVVAEPEPPPIEVEGDEALDRVAAVAQAVLPSVVRIDIGGADGPGVAGNGSGVIYSADGHIITNNHVVAEAGSIEVLLNDGSRVDAEVIGTDHRNDLAVIKVDRQGLPAIRIGDSAAIKVGEVAVAVGSPFGLEGTVTAGVISALNRMVQVNDPTHGPLTLPNVIQTDASINPGNSGGPLVNGEGELIGINSAILTRAGGFGQPANAGVGFAVPSATAQHVAEQLIANGEIRYAFLGVGGDNVSSDIAERVGVDGGAYIEQILEGTPAAEAGLREGDVIVAIDDVEIASMEDLIVEIMRRDIGETVAVTYIRDGEERETEAVLSERPEE